MFRLRVSLPVSVLTAFLLIFIFANALAQNPDTNERVGSDNYDQIRQTILSDGSASVIVEIALPNGYLLEGTLDHDEAVQDQRRAILNTQEQLLNELAGYEAEIAYRYAIYPLLAMRVDAQALGVLMNSAHVVRIHEDRLLEPTLAGSTVVIGAPTVWSMGFEGEGQTVVVLDTGIDADHPFFGGRVAMEACFSNANNSGPYTSLCPNGLGTQSGPGSADAEVAACFFGPFNDCEHGSHVAGIAAGQGNSFSGVAPSADIIAIQVFTNIDTGVGSYVSDQVAALQYVTTNLLPAHSIASINMSLGGSEHTEPCPSAPQAAAINNLRSLGVATVIASGNEDWVDRLGSPGCVPGAITVGATQDNDVLADFSNMHSVVDLLAPGVDIDSSIPGGQFYSLDGTSMAAPHVAGVWAVMREIAPQASIDDLERILENSGTLVTDDRVGGTITKPRIRMDVAIADGLDILDPTTADPGLVGPYDNPQQTNVRVTKPTAGLALNRFAVIVGGLEAQLMSVTEESDAYLITFLPPVQDANGLYDVVVSAVLESELAVEKQVNALEYGDNSSGAEPDPPQNLNASDGTLIAEVRLTWTKSDGATRYDIYRSEPGQNNWELLSSRDGLYDFSSDGTNIDGTVLDYAVKACSDDGCSLFSSPDSGYADMPQLNNPNNADGDDTFVVSWVPATTASSHDLQESHDSGPWNDIYSGSMTSINRTGMADGQWCYRVRGYNGIQLESPWTSPRCATVGDDGAGQIYLPFVRSPEPPPPPPTAIVNGNFESGPNVGWIESSFQGWRLIFNQSELPDSFTLVPHSGTWLAWLGGDDNEIAHIEQTITVPAATPYLAYWHYIASEDACGFDFGGVMIDGTTVVDVYDLCQDTNTGAWVQHVVDLHSYIGQTVALQILVETDDSLNSNLFVDDVSFQANGGAAFTGSNTLRGQQDMASPKRLGRLSDALGQRTAERLFLPRELSGKLITR